MGDLRGLESYEAGAVTPSDAGAAAGDGVASNEASTHLAPGEVSSSTRVDAEAAAVDGPASSDASARADVVRRAAAAWRRQLIDLSGNNKLLYYRDLRTGTLDLRSDDYESLQQSAIDQLLLGNTVRLSAIFKDEDELRDAARRARTIASKAREAFEERGLRTLYLAMGMARWDEQKSQATPAAPVLLLPLQMKARGTAGEDFELRLVDDPEVNPVLIHKLSNDFGVKADISVFDDLLENEDRNLAYRDIYERLTKFADGVAPGFAIDDRLIISNFSYFKLPMVRDLEEHEAALIAHDIAAAIAGDESARARVREHLEVDAPLDLPDQQPPADEFLVLDADATQSRAINRVVSGSCLIIKGPPGTGKSQTIANLLATLAARGRRVLFVAEKRAAIDAVVKRLTQVGLGDLVLDLHGRSGARRLVAADLQRSLRAAAATALPDHSKTHDRLVARRSALSEYTRALHEPRKPWGVSLFNAEVELLGTPEQARLEYRFDHTTLQHLDEDRFREAERVLERFAGFGGLPSPPSPWHGAVLRTPEDVERALKLASELATSLLLDTKRVVSEVVAANGLRPPQTIAATGDLLLLLDGVARTMSVFSEGIYVEDLEPLIPRLRRAGMGALFSAECRAARRTVKRHLRPGVDRGDLPEHVSEALRDKEQWRRHSLDDGDLLPRSPVGLDDLRAAWDRLDSRVYELESFFGDTSLRAHTFDDLLDFTEHLTQDRVTARRLPGTWEAWDQLCDMGLEPFLQAAADGEVPAEQLVAALRWCWLHSIYDREILRDRRVTDLEAGYHERVVQEFQTADREHIASTPARVRRAVAERIVAARDAFPTQSALVTQEAAKKRRHIPLRKLLHDAPDVVGALRPCWVMSPLEVSQLLPGDRPYFDVVIFDEASQVTPADAIPAILRGRQLVVAGDDQQLPPTTFFIGNQDDEARDEYEDEPEVSTEGVESILGGVEAIFPFQALGWHYRSRDERLIAFSNTYFYDRSLTTFPGALGMEALRHLRAPAPAPGLGPDESAAAEVALVVEAILEHARERPDESLGVIALGIHHANRITEALRQALIEDRSLEEFFAEDREEPFFIKNLERVQGDERDAIILSVGYSKRNADGRLTYHFGPLLLESGERRLNVAVTRAKRRLTLVSSFGSADMDPSRTTRRGVELLRRYLQYVESAGTNLGEGPRENPALNPFEISVRDALERAGIPVIAQYGVSGYTIDFVAQHPEEPGRFVLAIECDGASYHSQPTTRDRDRLRQEQLERLGWRFHRIWSTDWFNNREKEIERAKEAYRKAVDEADRCPDVKPTKGSTPQDPPMATRVGPRPPVVAGRPIGAYRDTELRKLVDWIESDTLLRTEEELVRDLMTELGFKRRGQVIDRRLREAIASAREQRRK